jgi:hypothetical protein
MWLHANFGSDRSGCLCIPKHWSHQMIVILHVKTLCLQEDVRLTSRDVTRHWQSVSDQSNTLQNKPSLGFDSSTQNLPVVEVPLRAWDTNKSRICLTGSTATRLKQAFLFPSILVTCAGEALHRLHLFQPRQPASWSSSCGQVENLSCNRDGKSIPISLQAVTLGKSLNFKVHRCVPCFYHYAHGDWTIRRQQLDTQWRQLDFIPHQTFFCRECISLYSLVDEKPLKQLSKKNIKQLYDKWRPASTSPHVATCRNTPSQHWRSTSFRSSRLSAEVLCVQLSSAAPSGPEPTQTGSMIGRARIVGL